MMLMTGLFFCLGVGGCDTSKEGGEPASESSIVARSGADGAWAERERWSLSEQGRIGSAASEGADMFANIVGLEIDPLGRIWVADAQLHQIRVFGPDGTHVRSLGKRGGGPGEFEAIAGIDWGPGGNLWVADGGNARYTVFDTAGVLVATHPRMAAVTMAPWTGGFDGKGHLYDTEGIPGERGELTDALVRYDPVLQPVDTFPIPTFEGDFLELVSPDGRSRNRTNVPFTGSQIWAFDPEGFVWTANTGRYRLVRQTFKGDTVRIVERAAEPVRVTDAEMDRMLENYSWFLEKGGKLDRSRIPKTKPPLSTFFFDSEGGLWVLPTRAEQASPSFDVFDRSGRYLGRIPTEVPIASAPAPVVRGDRLAGVTKDENGVPTVVVMRLRKP
jgi:hypothetical protein